MERFRLGALGGPETFGGQAAAMVVETYPEFGEVRYFERSAEAFAGPDPVEARCVPARSSRTGPYDFAHREILHARPPRYVVAEVRHRYHCALLGPPGARLERIQLVLGHTGSIAQSRAWLDKHLPAAAVRIVDTSSLAAGIEARDGGGTVAAVGTLEAAQALGLTTLAADIDGGSVGLYWVFSLVPRVASVPNRVVVTCPSTMGGSLSTVVSALNGAGFAATSVWMEQTGQPDLDAGWVASFEGECPLSAVEAAMERSPDARLTGAYVAHGPGDTTDVHAAAMAGQVEQP